MLIIDNIDLPMPAKPTLYDDVMNVWINAMRMLENLVSGMAQSVVSGEVLLGLSGMWLFTLFPFLILLHESSNPHLRSDQLDRPHVHPPQRPHSTSWHVRGTHVNCTD